MNTQESFFRWLKRARPGSRFTYHVGMLDRDREHDPALSTFADKVWRAQEQGKVCLVQRRLGPMEFEYIAQKRKER